MKRAKPATSKARARTGRDGAIDYALRIENPDPKQQMGDHVYRVIEIVGTSEESIEDAIDAAVARAHKTLRNLRWFEVIRTSGHIDSGRVRHFQVTLKVGFTMEEAG
jgi:flavin-binding protein dodecin